MADGPLNGLKVLELGGLGPVPFCAMMLSDMGADVVRVERPNGVRIDALSGKYQFDARGRRSVALDLKDPDDAGRALDLIAKAEIVLEGYRPGVVERLGVGPEEAFARNPRLVYGRLTGFGQTGPYAQIAGHDPNFVALSGIMHMIGTREKPVMPLVLVGDYGGALTHLVGVLSALHHARQTGEGQVVDTAISDAVAYMATTVFMMIAAGMWSNVREANFLDGGAPFAGNFVCKDGLWVTLGASEPKHWAALLERLGLTETVTQSLLDRSSWPQMRAAIAGAFASKTRAEWCSIMEGHDVCFAPVLTYEEAFVDPHNVARGTFVEAEGAIQPTLPPRFSRTPGAMQGPPPVPGADSDTVFADWGA